MTPPINDPATLRHILTNTDALLLDFDGPVCSLFSGIPAPVVAEQLRQVLAEGGHNGLPEDIRAADDPFDVLFYAAKLGQDEVRYVEAAFRAHEVEAVQSARPTPSSAELMHAWTETGQRLAIVSNNSTRAVETYLDVHDLRAIVSHVSARSNADITVLKPNPHLVTKAVHELGSRVTDCALVGDSLTDIEASHAAGVRALAFANKLGKIERFTTAEPAAIVTTIGSLVEACRR